MSGATHLVASNGSDPVLIERALKSAGTDDVRASARDERERSGLAELASDLTRVVREDALRNLEKVIRVLAHDLWREEREADAAHTRNELDVERRTGNVPFPVGVFHLAAHESDRTGTADAFDRALDVFLLLLHMHRSAVRAIRHRLVSVGELRELMIGNEVCHGENPLGVGQSPSGVISKRLHARPKPAQIPAPVRKAFHTARLASKMPPMPQIVKVTKEEIRQWRNVASMLIDPSGTPLREVTELERKILSELSKRAREKKRGVEWSDGQKVIRVLLVEDKPGIWKLEKTIDGLGIENGRTLLRKKFFEKYGECQLRKPSGHFHATIRNPDSEQTNEMREELARRRDRKIHGGKLREFGKTKEDTFGGTFAPIDPKTSGKPTKHKSQKNAPISPDKCDCQKWAKTEGSVDGEHHPICGKREAWEKENGRKNGESKKVLVDLNTRDVLREATAEEVRLSGDLGVLQVGDHTYGVVPAEEAPSAPT